MENNNIIQHATGTIIINGGNALPGCPNDFDEAKAIEEKFNEGKSEDEPQWAFDYGFKLDYDGPLLHISSRFYPPKTHYGPTWDGNVTLYLLDNEIAKKKFDCRTLDELKSQVDNYIKSLVDSLKGAFQSV